MADMTTWAYDAATGVYKNHALSGKLLTVAAGEFVFVPFTKKVEGFGKKMGEYVTLTHWKELDEPTSAQLEERTKIPVEKLEQGTRQLQVLEWGRGIEYSNLFDELSLFSPGEGAQKVLKNQMVKCMDSAAAGAFKAAKVCFIPTSLTGGTWDTDGTPSTTATVNITADHLGVIRDYMANDLHVPFFEKGAYIGLAATKALRGLKSDRKIEAWNMYLRKGDFIYNSEVGRCEAIRLVEVTHESALSNGVGTGSVLGEMVIFGDEAVSRVEVDAPELRADPNYKSDFGRSKACAWYGIVNYGTTWDSADDGEARIIRVASL